MPNTKNPILESLRILPKDTEFLDRKIGARGEVYFDPDSTTLRLFDGVLAGGIPLLRADLSNLEGQISSVILSDTAPTGSEPGTIWVDTSTLKLYVYYSDGNSSQWVQPQTSSYGSGSGSTTLVGLSDVQVTSPTSGQVLKYNGTKWVNGTDNTGGGGGGGATMLDELTDVVVSSPSTDQILKYNGTTWVNSAAGGVTSITAGSNITISGSTGNVTISSTASGGATEFSSLTDAVSTSLTVDKIYMPAIARLAVTNSSTTAYLFNSHYSGNNPTIYVISGTTIAFNLQASGHPFLIQDGTGTNYNTGLVHVSTAGVVSTGASAQGKDSGTLYWQIPMSIGGSNYRYQCGAHIAMVGTIIIKNFVSL